MTKDFGVVVTCCSGDYMFVKGCCASIRYFMGDIPICILIDGEFPLENLPELYGAKILKRENVQDPLLRSQSYGWGITKMVAFWESPFEYFLLIDADTIVWGDVRKLAAFDKYDVIIHDHGNWTEKQVTQWFFNVDSIRTYFPKFTLRSTGYANSGVMFAKRGIFSIREYQEMLAFVEAHPDIFFPGEQGFLNFMLFRGQEEGKIRVGNASIQYIVSDHAIEEPKAKFVLKDGNPVIDAEPTVLHWCGPKPFIKNRIPLYTDTMTFFRKQHLINMGLKSEKTVVRQISREERKLKTKVFLNQLKPRLKSILKTAYNALRQ